MVGIERTRGALEFSFEVGSAPPEAAIDFIRKYHLLDPFRPHALAAPEGVWLRNDQVLSDRQRSLDRYYQEFYLPYGGVWHATCKLHEDTSHVVLFSVHCLDALTESQLRLLARLGRHLSQAVKLWIASAAGVAAGAPGLEVLRRWRQAALLIDSKRRIAFRNPAADRVLQAEAELDVAGGALFARSRVNDARLHLGLRALRLDGTSYLDDRPPEERVFLALDRARAPRLGVYLLALRSSGTLQAFGSGDAALVLLHQAGLRPVIDPFIVAATWDLTPAEARIAALLATGSPLDDIAAERRVSRETVRSQAKVVYEKLGVRRQAELVAKLAALPGGAFSDAVALQPPAPRGR